MKFLSLTAVEISLTKNLERKKKEQTKGRTNRRMPICNPTIQLVVVDLYTKYEVSILNGCGDIFDEKVLRNYGRTDGTTDRCKPVYPPLFQSGGIILGSKESVPCVKNSGIKWQVYQNTLYHLHTFSSTNICKNFSVVKLICLPFFQLGSYFIHLTDDERNLRQQVQDLKLEQSSVSMSDEFAKYMKLQRKIDRLVDQIKKMGKFWQTKAMQAYRQKWVSLWAKMGKFMGSA